MQSLIQDSEVERPGILDRLDLGALISQSIIPWHPRFLGTLVSQTIAPRRDFQVECACTKQYRVNT